MPKLTVEELVGYGFAVAQGERQLVEGGMPVFNGSGEPKMEPLWLLSLAAVGPDGSRHEVRIPFNREGRDKLVEGLTGIQVASQLPKSEIVL